MKASQLIKYLLISCALIFLTNALSAQDCANLIPLKEGTKMEIKHYNAKDKLQSTSFTTIKSKKITAKGYEVSVDVKSVEEKGKKENSSTLTFKCEAGVFIWDMNDMMKGAMPGEGMENMNIKVSGAALKFPAKLAVGQKLDDAEMTIAMESGGMTMMTVTMRFINRKVESMEKITTPAGTYNCYKITYEVESKAMFTSKTRQIDWMAEGVGMVRTESYDQKDKLQSYSVLSSFSE